MLSKLILQRELLHSKQLNCVIFSVTTTLSHSLMLLRISQMLIGYWLAMGGGISAHWKKYSDLWGVATLVMSLMTILFLSAVYVWSFRFSVVLLSWHWANSGLFWRSREVLAQLCSVLFPESCWHSPWCCFCFSLSGTSCEHKQPSMSFRIDASDFAF